MAKIGEYRKLLEDMQNSARQLVLDEIEGEVKRLLEYIEDIDLDSKEELQEGINYTKASLKELAEKLY